MQEGNKPGAAFLERVKMGRAGDMGTFGLWEDESVRELTGRTRFPKPAECAGGIPPGTVRNTVELRSDLAV